MSCIELRFSGPSRVYVQICVSFSSELARKLHTAFLPHRKLITKRSPTQLSCADPSVDAERIDGRDQSKPADLAAGAMNRAQAFARPLRILKYIDIAVSPGIEKSLNLF